MELCRQFFFQRIRGTNLRRKKSFGSGKNREINEIEKKKKIAKKITVFPNQVQYNFAIILYSTNMYYGLCGESDTVKNNITYAGGN